MQTGNCCLLFWRENGEHTKEKEERMKFWVPSCLRFHDLPSFSTAESKSRWSETSTDDLSEATPKQNVGRGCHLNIWGTIDDDGTFWLSPTAGTNPSCPTEHHSLAPCQEAGSYEGTRGSDPTATKKTQVAILPAPFLGEVRMTNFPKRVGIWCEILNWFLRSRRKNDVFVLTFGWFIFQINQWNLHELQVTAFSFIGDRFVKMFLEMSVNIQWSGWHYFHPHTIEEGWTAKASTTCREVSPKIPVRSKGL